MHWRRFGKWVCGLMFVGLAGWLGCARAPEANLIIIHSGRLLGNVYPLSSRGLAPLQYYQYLAGYIEQVRAEAAANGQQVLLIDSGDALAGSFAAHATESENVIELLKVLKYDAIVLGNLDANLPPAVVERLKPIPVLTPFVRLDGAPAIPGAEVAARIDKGSMKIDLVANFYGDTPVEQHPLRFPTYYAADPQVKVVPFRDYEKLLDQRAQEPAHLTLLNWFKFEAPKTVPAWLGKLAGNGVDAVLAHRIYDSKTKETWGAGNYDSWPVPVSENILRQNRGFAIARLDLRVVPGAKPEVMRNELIQLTANTAAPSADIVARMEKFKPRLEAADSEVGEVTEALSREDILQTYLQSLATQGGGDAVLYSIESIRAEWPQGPLRFSRVYEALPWDNSVVSIELTPGEWANLRASGGLVLIVREGLEPSQNVKLTTSAFFAARLRDDLGIAPARIRALGPEPENQRFAGYLKSHGKIGKPKPLAGWSVRSDE